MPQFTIPTGLEGEELPTLIFTTIRNRSGQGITFDELQSIFPELTETRLQDILNNLSRRNYIVLAFDINECPRYIAFPSFYCFVVYCAMQETYSNQLDTNIRRGITPEEHIFHMTDKYLVKLLNRKQLFSKRPISLENVRYLINQLLQGEYIGYHSENTYYFHHVGYTSCVEEQSLTFSSTI
jgi:uncharacterized protein YfbU (UPF0304 family)